MSTREFMYERPDGELAGPVSLDAVIAAAKRHLDQGQGPFDGSVDGRSLWENKSRARSLRRLRKALAEGKVGQTFRIRGNAGVGVVFKVREVQEVVDVIDTNGNDHADAFWSWVVATYPQYHPRFAGAYVCKDIAGSSTPSQHSYGNGVDIFFDTLEHQREVFHDVMAGKAPVPVCHAISETNIGGVCPSPVAVHHYDGEFHAHLHTDYCPQYSGGCGVRG